jgi:rRNA biogenesis protein RRP5
MSSARKRNLKQNTSEPKAKKAKVARESKTLETSQAENPVYGENTPLVSNLVNDEVDFPRGGGTSFTPFEVKAIQHEGLEEADQALFKVRFSA